MRRMLRASSTIVCVASAGLLLAASEALATFPGRSGLLAVDIETECGERIATMKADGSDGRYLIPADCEAASTNAYSPEWTPDGRRLFLTFETRDSFETPSRRRIAVMNADGSGLADVPLDLGTDFSSGQPRHPDDLSFSPDGNHFVYTRSVRRAPGYEIWKATLDGSEHVKLRAGRVAKWSPDGEAIAYGDGIRGEIWLMGAESGKRIRRVVRKGGSLLDWSPDSRRLLYATNPYDFEGPGDIYSVATSGRQATRLTFTPRRQEWSGVFSPNGRRIAYSTLYESGDEWTYCSIRTISARGKPRPKRLFKFDGEGCNAQVSWQPLPVDAP
jgi:Tol biopolymer transport system component